MVDDMADTTKTKTSAQDMDGDAEDGLGMMVVGGTLRDFITQQKLEMLKNEEKPPLSYWEQILITIYNPEEGRSLGRSISELLFTIAFHILFYGCLAGFIFVLANYHPDIYEHENMPHYVGHDSLFRDGTIPLGLLPVNEGNRQSLMIRFKPMHPETLESYVKQLKALVEAEEQNPDAYTDDCSERGLDTEWEDGDKLCKVYNKGAGGADWGPCTPENEFGYANGKPCVLLKLNRALMWTPKNVTITESMTDFVQNELNYETENVPVWSSSQSQIRNLTQKDRVVCFSCDGASGFEQEVIGRISYYPVVSPVHPAGPCLPLYYFPFKNQPHYQSPFVFAEFAEVPWNIALQVRCTAFNIGINRDPGIGTHHFELLVTG